TRRVAPLPLLRYLLVALGGFLRIHPSSPARGGNPSLTRNIEPKSTGSYTQSLPPVFPLHPISLFLFPLLHSSPPETPLLPPTVPPANPSILVFPRARVTRRPPSLLLPLPMQTGRLLEEVGWKRKETNRIG
ncbi:hypothetical protein H1C71_028259, partial [Ictidomys tridecemlineatus]